MCAYYLYGKKGHIAKNCWQNGSGQPKQAKSTGKGKGHIAQLEVQLNSIQSQIDTMILVLKTNIGSIKICKKTSREATKKQGV